MQTRYDQIDNPRGDIEVDEGVKGGFQGKQDRCRNENQGIKHQFGCPQLDGKALEEDYRQDVGAPS